MNDAYGKNFTSRLSNIKISKQPYIVSACFCRGGFGYLKKNVKGFNNASKASVFLLLTDLDTTECAPTL